MIDLAIEILIFIAGVCFGFNIAIKGEEEEKKL